MRKWIIALMLIFAAASPWVMAEGGFATRGEVADMLIKAADDYNAEVKKSDIIQGYDDGMLHEDRYITRAEALVMLKRAFGGLPKPAGYNALCTIPRETFTDVPEWAQTELDNVFDAGIVSGTSEGIFSPDENVTTEQMKLFINRTYALFASNLKDDFYAAVNKDTLNNLEIRPGKVNSGTLYNLTDKSTEQVDGILQEITKGTYPKGSKEQKISDFYRNILNMDARNDVGIQPLKKYLEAIDKTQTFADIMNVHHMINQELCITPFIGFGWTSDVKDSNHTMLSFNTFSATLPKDTYLSGTAEQKAAYTKYLSTLLRLLGQDNAEEQAGSFWDLEVQIAAASMNSQDYADVDKIYNIFTMRELKDIFSNIDLDAVFADSHLDFEDRFLVQDVNCMKELATLLNSEHLEQLKTALRICLALGWGGALNQEFIDASNQFQQDLYGVTGCYSPEERAALMLKSAMPDYIGELYAKLCFSETAKNDVKKMVDDIIAVYRSRIENLSWLSDATKEKALKKLNTLGIKIGYPDKWETAIDDIDILPVSEGGSYFDNMLAITKAEQADYISRQHEPIDKTKWTMYPFTANACYSPLSNDITFPAAILQAPLYDVNASYEQNLGGIGYIIAHEITHAFDNNGAKFDENGNAADWWTAEDYKAFQKLCDDLIAFYDGQEAIPGIPMNGTLTLSENVADQGAVSCITEIVSRLENPDFKTLYESIANCWASIATRSYAQLAMQADVHSADKLRVNRVIVNCDEFYTAFDIREGDGMYVAPEDRVKIW